MHANRCAEEGACDPESLRTGEGVGRRRRARVGIPFAEGISVACDRMPADRFESFALGLGLDESFFRELPTATRDDVLRAISESRLGRDFEAGGGTCASFMADKHTTKKRPRLHLVQLPS